MKIVHHDNWGKQFAIGIIFSTIGLLILNYVEALVLVQCGSGLSKLSCDVVGYTALDVFFGVSLLIVGVVFDLLSFKNLITEAHVKALEVYYGKARCVKVTDVTIGADVVNTNVKGTEKQSKKSTYGWQSWE